jgi:2-polyprenyl-6-methoxyphenol hydroxylase-like FAD-dependent oxidoreductase
MSDKVHGRPRGPLQVIIIGGGIAGQALALFLDMAGIAGAVYEAYGDSHGIGGGLGLAPNGMNVIAALGLADKLKARGSLALESYFRDERGRLLARHDNGGDKYGQPLMSMMRSDVHAVLAEAIRARQIPIHHGRRLEWVEQGADGVIVHFADGTSAQGDLLIGADGVHSRTREQVMPEGPGPEFVGITGIGGAIALSDMPEFSPREAQSFTFTFGPNGFFGHCGGSAGEAMWWSNLPRDNPYTADELKSLSPDVLRRQLQQRYASYYEPIPSLIARTPNIIALNAWDIQSLPSWHRGRVMLIGDAAHAVSPNAGQGASLALEDAMMLAKLLRDYGSDHAAAFERFERDRKPRVERIVAAGRRYASDKTIVSPLRSKIRNLMIGAMFRLFGIPGQDWAFRYRIDWDAPAPAEQKAA